MGTWFTSGRSGEVWSTGPPRTWTPFCGHISDWTDDIVAIHDDLSARDERIARLVRKYPHLRVLRQPDPWECVVAYICSATNNVSRISTIVEKIAETLGRQLRLDSEVRHTFPTPDAVLEAGVDPLKQLGLGMDRHTKIVAAAERIRDGRLDLRRLSQPDVCYAEAKRRLMACYGIGGKGGRLHLVVCAGQDGGVSRRQVGGESHEVLLPVRRTALGR